MREIKFRGQMLNGNKIVYGDLSHVSDMIAVDRCCVDPDSVAQLVGYDANGEEIYEGDTVVNPRDNTTFKAAMNHIYTIKIYAKK